MNLAGAQLLLVWTLLHSKASKEAGNGTENCTTQATYPNQCSSEGFTCSSTDGDPLSFTINCDRSNASTTVSNCTSTCPIQCSYEGLTCNITYRDQRSISINCSRSDAGTTVSNCTCPSNCSTWEGLQKVWEFLQRPEVLIAFFTGVLLSALVCCCDRRCCRQKMRRQKSVIGPSGDGGEVAKAHELPLVDRQQAGPREVEYSDIDFSRWNRKPPAGRKDKPQAAETEYAELQKEGCREEMAEGLEYIGEEVEAQVEAPVEEEMAVVVEVEEMEEVAADEE